MGFSRETGGNATDGLTMGEGGDPSTLFNDGVFGGGSQRVTQMAHGREGGSEVTVCHSTALVSNGRRPMRGSAVMSRQIADMLYPLGEVNAVACLIEVLPKATESPAGYIHGAIRNGYSPARKAQAWAETVLWCGRCLLDDTREGEWGEAFKRLGQSGLTPDRARQFRENYVKDVGDILRSLS